jgi:SAM-dependent methyltransferase
MTVFDRRAVRLHRDRSAISEAAGGFFLAEAADRLADRLDDVRRRFPLALELGCRRGDLARVLAGRGGIERMVGCDLSPRFAALAPGPAVACDEEFLPFAEETFDLVLSCMALHWVNDLPGTLLQIRRLLKPDGMFLASMVGGHTLKELRHALAQAEIACWGGLSPRVSPFADVKDAGNLLQRAGFALPVADSETVTVSYADPLRLLADLRAEGETNAAIGRCPGMTPRGLLLDALDRYRQQFDDGNGRVPATVQIVTLIGWTPHDSQPKPLKRGSAKVELAHALSRAGSEPGEPS